MYENVLNTGLQIKFHKAQIPRRWLHQRFSGQFVLGMTQNIPDFAMGIIIILWFVAPKQVIDVKLLWVRWDQFPFSHGVRDKLVEIHVNELEYDVFIED